MTGQRWGVLGGTFDPIHYGHLAIAENAREQLGLAGVLFIPAAQPPHKLGLPISPPEHRLAMVKLATADNDAFTVSPIELDREGPSYSADTLEALTAARPGDRFVFIVSAEAAREMPNWRNPRRLLELTEVAVVPRLGYPAVDPAATEAAFGDLAGRFIDLDMPSLGHSASAIRSRVRASRSIRYLVPPQVEDYIESNGLYR